MILKQFIEIVQLNHGKGYMFFDDWVGLFEAIIS